MTCCAWLTAGLLLAAASCPLVAETYHVSSSSGDDTRDGRSPATAWRSIARVNRVTVEPGDSLLFRRGDVWNGATLLWFTESGTAERPIVIAAYGDGAAPVLSDIAPVPGSNDPLRWRQIGPSLWGLTCLETPNRLWLDGVEVLRSVIPEDVGATNSQGTFEAWHHRKEDSTLLLWCDGNPAMTYRSIEGTRPDGVLALYRSEHMVIDGLDLRGGRWSTVYGGACAYITFRNCRMGFGLSGLVLTSADPAASAHHVIIEHCVFDSGMNFRYGLSSLGTAGPWDSSKRGSEDAVYFGDAVHSCIIRHCTFNGWGHAAVNLYAPDSSFGGVYGNQIHDNTFSGGNLSYTRPFGTAGAENRCHHNAFYNNHVRDHSVRTQLNGNHNHVYNNVFDGMTTSPARYFGSDGSGQGILLSVYGTNLVCHHNRIEHNLFLHTAEAAVAIWGHGFPNPARDNVIRNNIFLATGRMTARPADSGAALLFRDSLQVYRNVVQNNCFFGDGAARQAIILYHGRRLTLPQFEQQNGRYGDVLSANLLADPLLRDTAAGEYRLRPGSPCIDAGAIIPDITTDASGQPRLSGPAPDIGPFEYPALTSATTLVPPSVRSAIHPHPAAGIVTVTLDVPVRNATLRIHGVDGTLLLERREISGRVITFDSSPLPRGMYAYIVRTESTTLAAGMFFRR